MNIPPPPRVVRWLIQVIWLPMVALLSALLAVFFVIAVLLWPIDRKFRTARVIALVLAFLWIDAGLITGCFYIWLKWIVKGNFRERGPQWRLEHEELLLDALNGIMEHAHKWVGLRVEFEEPMDFGLEEAPLLAFPRHAGPGDSIVLAWMLAALAGRMPRVVLKDFLLWDPGIGCVLGRMESYFVPSRSGAGDDRTQPLLDMAASLDRIDAVLLFPEGQNWTPYRWRKLIERLRARGDNERADQAASWRYVMPPLQRGVQLAMSERPDADVIVIATTGLEWLVSPWQIFKAIPLQDDPMLLRSWTFTPSERPTDPEEIGVWLDERWDILNDWVGSHQKYRPEWGMRRIDAEDQSPSGSA